MSRYLELRSSETHQKPGFGSAAVSSSVIVGLRSNSLVFKLDISVFLKSKYTLKFGSFDLDPTAIDVLTVCMHGIVDYSKSKSYVTTCSKKKSYVTSYIHGSFLKTMYFTVYTSNSIYKH